MGGGWDQGGMGLLITSSFPLHLPRGAWFDQLQAPLLREGGRAMMGRQEIGMMIGGLRGVGGCQGAGKQGSAQGVFGLTSWQDQQSPPVPTKEVKSPNGQTQWHLH